MISDQYKKYIRILGLVVSLSLFSFIAQAYFSVSDGDFHIFLPELSIGDGFFIKTPHGKWIVIDGGNKEDVLLSAFSKSSSPLARDIDLVVLTHYDKDHTEGVLSLLRFFSVKNIMLPSFPKEIPQNIQEIIEEKHIPVLLAKRGQAFFLDDTTLSIISPTKEEEDGTSDNNASLVFFLETPFSRALFTGDIEKKKELSLLSLPFAFKSDLLKVPHHGSKSSSSDIFLSAVSPSFALISAGKDNPYGHPHSEVLRRFLKRKIQVFSSKERGSIHLSLSQKGIQEIFPMISFQK